MVSRSRGSLPPSTCTDVALAFRTFSSPAARSSTSASWRCFAINFSRTDGTAQIAESYKSASAGCFPSSSCVADCRPISMRTSSKWGCRSLPPSRLRLGKHFNFAGVCVHLRLLISGSALLRAVVHLCLERLQLAVGLSQLLAQAQHLWIGSTRRQRRDQARSTPVGVQRRKPA